MINKGKDRITIIDPSTGVKNYLYDLWYYKDLLFVLTWRDLKVRYKQTLIGIAWVVIRPLITIIVFTFVFGRIAQLPSEGELPYSVMVILGLLPWQFLSSCISDTSSSLITNQTLVTRVYFPRLIIPISSILTCMVDFLVTLIIVLPVIFWFDVVPSWRVLLLPIFIIGLVFIGVGAGCFLATLNVTYRDFRYILPFIIQLGLYISPVGYSSSIVPEDLKFVYAFNPMVGIIDGFRWCWQGIEVPFPVFSVGCSFLMGIVMLIVGLFTFRTMEKSFADVI